MQYFHKCSTMICSHIIGMIQRSLKIAASKKEAGISVQTCLMNCFCRSLSFSIADEVPRICNALHS